jgi:hypothetical protein
MAATSKLSKVGAAAALTLASLLDPALPPPQALKAAAHAAVSNQWEGVSLVSGNLSLGMACSRSQ